MKTPMQEAIELIDKKMEPILMVTSKYPDLLSKVDKNVLSTYQQVQRDLYGMLEKEKEVIENAHFEGQCDETEGYPLEIAKKFYNETYNTEKK